MFGDSFFETTVTSSNLVGTDFFAARRHHEFERRLLACAAANHTLPSCASLVCCVDDAHLSACCLDARRERLTLQLQACICVEHRSQPKPVSDSVSTGEPTVLSSSPSLMRMGLAAEPKAASHSVPDQPICDQ